MKDEHKEIIKYAFESFSFLLEEGLNYDFEAFANIISNHYKNKRVEYCCNILRKYKGVVTETNLIIDIK